MDKTSFFASLRKPPQHVMTLGDVEIFAKQMTVKQRDDFESKVLGKSVESTRAFFILACACDANGNLLFSDDDHQAIMDMPISVGQPLFDCIVKINPLTMEDMTDLKKS